ncbi:PadR family transcriptional regulator [Burkholderia sp. FERM BP-3421]|uniref:PadR family transcriptional regulator n=1 Tax=Burkholderia sp. FERM BP-3421 TaxID=1494466 RepID=UPI003FCE692C
MRHRHPHSHAHHGRHGDGWGRHPMAELFWQAIGRHRGGGGGGRRGFGPFGGGGFGGDDEGLPRGRQFTSDDLQLLLLALLAEQPSHGYELIKALDTRSSGFYAPSPGMVYPALTYLEEVGYVTVEVEGNRKRYALADAGRDHLASQREQVELLFAKLTHFGRKMEFMRRAFAGEGAEAGDDTRGWLKDFVEARLALKRALLHKAGASADEQRRIAAILLRAATEIESGSAA